MIWRYRLLLVLFLCAFISILSRLFYWQVIRADELVGIAESQYGRFIQEIPIRGEIKTSDGFPIATNKIRYLVAANPKIIPDDEKNKTVRLLSSAISTDESTISAILSQDKFWVPLKHLISSQEKKNIESLNLPGIFFEDKFVRYYPEASLAAKLIGFVGKDELGNNKGYFGIEGYYDRQLSGKIGLAREIKDAHGRPILAKVNENTAKIDGRNLILHIDRFAQYVLDDALKKGLMKYGAIAASGIIIDPESGGVLAMSGYPTFDPEEYNNYSNDLYLNTMISSGYEPGSTFKPLVMAAAIDSKLVTADTICTICDKEVEIGGFTIKTWNDTYQPGITMANVIRDSDNTGMVFVAQKLGLSRLYKYLKAFGIGDITGIDLQGEMAPDIRSIESWYPIDLATASFGQGISITPIELISAFSSLANNGKRMMPQVVDKVETPDGETIDIEPKVISQVVSGRTALIMREMLVNAVKAGEAKWAAPKGYRIAGKTGTAQIPIEGHYDANKTIASFIGFAPADDPKFVMLIIYDRPSTSIYGAETAAPTFFDVAKKLLAYYKIPPSE